MSNRILLVEDDQSFGAVLKDYLSINNFEVTLAVDGEQGLKEFTENEFDICIFDVMMPKKDGFSLAEDVKRIDKNIPIIFLTARNLLCQHRNDFMPRDLALRKIWKKENYFTARSMDVYIAKLRKLLRDDDGLEIINVHGEGFRLLVKN